ncbi:acid phosphatase, class B [Legionella nautarum]|uniref:Acid phosphatase, class B n=1 Tax=Legionella nautarum TaxID=45070 RepID=A0A0W0WKH5_9GAMM|nr:HAD family acid phosphatase [Legionella nautarum]KTD32832.1 acid phosphatase, class B [Legionella nautarum]
MKKLSFRAISLGIALFLTSLAYAEPPNLGILKKELMTYHDSGLYLKEISCVVAKAQSYILQQAALNERQGNKKKLAIVLDIDETTLSNYKTIAQHRFSATRKQIVQDILAADAPAIQPMLALYSNARKHGIEVFFVTGRSMALMKATRKNLLSAGYNHWAGLYLRPDDYKQSSIIPFKSRARKSITQQGYTIVASIGDQYSDFKGGYAQKGFKLPNPYYYLP